VLAHFRITHNTVHGGGLFEGEATESGDPGDPILMRFGEAADLGEPREGRAVDPGEPIIEWLAHCYLLCF
jgi:hypothetical protein